MERLNVPELFSFPFTPYSIQHDFMTELYNALENKKCGIFESPTGTGKSLSIICGAIRWLKDHNQNEKDLIEVKIHDLTSKKKELSSNNTDWLKSQSEEIEITRSLNELKIRNSKIDEYYKKISVLKETKQKYINYRSKFCNKKKEEDFSEKASAKDAVENDDDDEDLLVDIDDQDVNDEEDEEKKYHPVKIYICSRTHSQLSQFIGEIRKSPFSSDVRVASLASRAKYCINPDVTRLKSVHLINERCLDLNGSQSKVTKKDSENVKVKKQKTTTCKCPYKKQEAIDELSDASLLNVLDVEDLVTAGKDFNACPYYSSRKAVEDAEVVLVPYNTILHKATREANGIKLENNVVIIDEAHNLLEALGQMYNSEVTFEQLQYANQQLKGYQSKYNTRFSAKNLLFIKKLIFITGTLRDLLEKNTEVTTQIFNPANFVFMANIDNFNMFTLFKFIKESKISHKLHSFSAKNPIVSTKSEDKKGIKNFLSSLENKQKGVEVKPEIEIKTKPPPSNPILAVSSFLESLTYCNNDGRVLMHHNKKFQFLLLNPSIQFKDIVKEARSVIVAGGTMKPMSEFKDRLFVNAGAEVSRITEFSCDHIISPENILPIILPTGIKNEQLLFNYGNRYKMGESLKSILIETCKIVKGGIVVFFPSYKYETWVWDQIKSINFQRPVFREPQKSSSVDEVLENYHKAVYKSAAKSALLLSVVGGKLSEGLNFSDDLGRCVIVVGLPYANIDAPDLKEKMTYLDKNEGIGAGKKFYENLCMKSVNQCIGRAVRHRNDYATVLLLDERYDRQSTKNALPAWIQRSLVQNNFKQAVESITNFFQRFQSNIK